MTIADLAQAIRDYHAIPNSHADITLINRLILGALNNARKKAERSHDFALAIVHATLSVSPSTGASLANAVVGVTTTPIKSIINAFMPQTGGGLLPITVRPRKEYVALVRTANERATWSSDSTVPPTAWTRTSNFNELHTLGQQVFLHPDPTTAVTIEIDGFRWLSAYTSITDIEATDLLLEHGHDFLMWSAILELNHRTEIFVPRQEGTLPPPRDMRDEAWESLILWDSFLHEEGRDHKLGY